MIYFVTLNISKQYNTSPYLYTVIIFRYLRATHHQYLLWSIYSPSNFYDLWFLGRVTCDTGEIEVSPDSGLWSQGDERFKPVILFVSSLAQHSTSPSHSISQTSATTDLQAACLPLLPHLPLPLPPWFLVPYLTWKSHPTRKCVFEQGPLEKALKDLNGLPKAPTSSPAPAAQVVVVQSPQAAVTAGAAAYTLTAVTDPAPATGPVATVGTLAGPAAPRVVAAAATTTPASATAITAAGPAAPTAPGAAAPISATATTTPAGATAIAAAGPAAPAAKAIVPNAGAPNAAASNAVAPNAAARAPATSTSTAAAGVAANPAGPASAAPSAVRK